LKGDEDLIMEQLLEKLLADLSIIQKVEKLELAEVDAITSQLSCTTSKAYIENTFVIKPETSLSTYLFEPILKAAEAITIPQAMAGNGFVDYLIRSTGRNPVAIEVKPLHICRKAEHASRLTKNPIANEFKKLADEFAGKHENQITRYLRDYDYVLFTNMEEVLFFNREAVAKFEPFAIKPIEAFLDALGSVGDIWECVRRIEDATEKRDLDKYFYEDLLKWYNILSGVSWTGDEKAAAESKVLLINKLIFVQTLEDYSLIPFRFLRDKYEDKHKMWATKGMKIFLERYLEEIEEWFYMYYDTELFKTPILGCIAQDDKNYERLATAIKDMLGFGLWDATFGRGLTFYNFRHVDEDVFGKAYEMFMAEHRKEQGIYYTPKEITTYMSEKLIEGTFGPVKEELLLALGANPIDYEKAKKCAEKLASLTILDPACGSGSFLIKALRSIFTIYQEIQARTAWAEKVESIEVIPVDIERRKDVVREIRILLGVSNDQDRRRIISLMILRHIHGVDLDERAIDVARVNLWKEAVKLQPEAFRYSSLSSGRDHILPALEMNLVCANSIATKPEIEWADLLDGYAEDIAAMNKIRDTYLDNPCDPEPLDQLQEIKQRLLARLADALGELPFDRPLIAPLEFFHIYFDHEGKPLKNPGFDGIIGNPPWENIKPFEKEFAAKHPHVFGEITKFALDGPGFELLFKRKLEESAVAELWIAYVNSIKQLSEFLKVRYSLYGTSDLSYQKIFLERAIELARTSVVILVPSNIHTDEGAFYLRKEILEKYHLKELFSFENRGHHWFHDVHAQFKFDIVHFVKENSNAPFMAKFQVRDWIEIANAYPYPSREIGLFSPRALGLMEFGGERDIEIARKIRGDHKLLCEMPLRLANEFHMTNDRGLFNTAMAGFSLYEGKTIYQYEPFFSKPRYWVEPEKGRSRLLGKELYRIKRLLNRDANDIFPDDQDRRSFVESQYAMAVAMFDADIFKLDHESYRLVVRDIASSTNERTLISCVAPNNVFLGNTLNYFRPFYFTVIEGNLEQNAINPLDLLFLMAVMNTFVLDYYIRMRVTSHFLAELPIPSPDATLRNRITQLAFSLLYRSPDFDVLAAELGFAPKELSVQERLETRAILDATIARDAFGLTREDMEHILGTFVYGTPDKKLMQNILDYF
jgi:hypothetical protein